MTKIRRMKARRTDAEVVQKVQYLALGENLTASQIHRSLEKDEAFTGRLPTLRTIQTIVKDAVFEDMTGPWSLSIADNGDDARLVLEVIPDLIRRTEGRVQQVTRARADLIVRIRQVVPDILPWHAYLLAIEYQRTGESDDGTANLDAYLAFAPWRDENRDLWQSMVSMGYVKDLPLTHFYHSEANVTQFRRRVNIPCRFICLYHGALW